MIKQGFVTLQEIGQDGMRVRAAAGSSSFRRKPTLDEFHKHAKAHVVQLEEERRKQDEGKGDDDRPTRTRHEAAADRADREREERIARAIQQSDQLRNKKRKDEDKEKVRVSTTDPDARVIVGVEVSGDGTDGGKLPPMLDQIEDRYRIIPERALVDSAYATKASVEFAELVGTAVVSTVPRSDQLREHGKDPHERQKGDRDEYEAFRRRMADPEYKELYKKRPSVAEFPNADCRNRGLNQLRVRGLAKATAVALWHALTFNLLRMVHMGAIA